MTTRNTPVTAEVSAAEEAQDSYGVGSVAEFLSEGFSIATPRQTGGDDVAPDDDEDAVDDAFTDDPDEGLDADEDDEEAEAESSEDETDDEDEDDEEEAPKPKRKPREVSPEDVTRYRNMVIESPGRIGQVPRRAMPEVVKSIAAAAFQAGAAKAAESLAAQSAQQDEVRSFVAERTSLQESDPEAFQQWEDENPEDAAKFHSAKAAIKARQAASAAPPNTLQMEADEQFARMAQLPEAIRAEVDAKLKAKAFNGREGLKEIRGIIDAAFVSAASAADNPVARKSKRREAAAEQRSKLARPVGREGGKSSDANSIKDVYDMGELLSRGLSS